MFGGIMNNQNILNAVPLQEAAVMISNELIKARYELEQTKKRLLEDKKAYEEAYVLANDGDSSENAPLEAAIQNLKLVTGEIGSNARVLQIMEGLEDVQYLIGTYDFINLYVATAKMSSASRTELYNAFEKLRKTEPDELSGNFMQFKTWVDNNEPTDKNNDCIEAILDFWKVATLPKYNTCGVIVPYTTVRLEMNGNLMTYRIYPEGVSFIDIGVMAANSRVARAILGKEKGQSVTIRHDSNSTLLEYKIIDIY